MDDDLLARAHALAEESFLAGSGPGGQNANKVATEVQLRANIYKLGLPPAVFARLREIAGSKLTASGDLLITAREHRTQEANRTAARARLEDMLEAAHHQPKKRAKSRVNRLGKVNRLKAKKTRSDVKAKRGKVSRSDW
ncbi:MAG: alternative ribosome rescue aminoacyl-tRNA hydrolase ArfB [Proteobacteria bacterium]|nr:alternative ribosome rescue aminoacyl-tRNA hydrolase ArfB [Pseudomonadota bacterium]MDA0915515.1 alternative ribosome rescue aminoacyl-tRNA hydrolase ArfB [Pseudomonadota bacterium]MDA1033194.1 alternative ribosome rescue aminoacyl-tRNA hydrolase ArfB [Pseudomonadota bacterium]